MMKRIWLQGLMMLSVALFIMACAGGSTQSDAEGSRAPAKEDYPVFGSILDSLKLEGSILVYDPQAKVMYSNNFERCDTGYLPASTFKIVNSIIALETGVVEDDSSMFYWDGGDRRLDMWERDMNLAEAFRLSCVPCYQEIARKIGAERMNTWLRELSYGNMHVDDDNIDVFWLEGDSRISQFDQLDFLQRYYQRKLPLSERTYSLMDRILIRRKTDEYVIRSKTGWSIREGNNVGWYVGFLENESGVYFFVTNIEPLPGFDLDGFNSVREEVTMLALNKLGYL